MERKRTGIRLWRAAPHESTRNGPSQPYCWRLDAVAQHSRQAGQRLIVSYRYTGRFASHHGRRAASAFSLSSALVTQSAGLLQKLLEHPDGGFCLSPSREAIALFFVRLDLYI